MARQETGQGTAPRCEEQLRLVIEAAGLGTWEYDALTGETVWSDRLMSILGLDQGTEFGYDRWLASVHPDDRRRVDALFQLSRDPDGHGVCHDEFRVVRPDGAVRWVDASGRAFFDEVNGARCLIRFFCSVADMTERKHSEEEMVASRQMLQLVMDNIPQRIFWKDRDSIYLGCNKTFAQDAGIEDPSSIVGKTDYDMPWKKEESDFFRGYDRRVMDGNATILHIIEPVLTADGRQTWVDTNKIPLHDAQGSVVGILGTYEDITERKLVEIERENARRALEEVYERERRIAETLQRSFLPDRIPQVPGYDLAQAYYPALNEAAIGGDMYDVFGLPSGKVGIAIADVSGKGLRAARYGAMVKYMLRAYAYRTEDPAEVLSLLNSSVATEMETDSFVSGFFGVLDPDSGCFTYGNAGHNEPLHIPCGTGIPVRIGPTGPVLGPEERAAYTSGTITLRKGDILLLYTDGVTDARGELDPMGIEGLEDHLLANCGLTADELVESVINEVNRRSGDRLADDVAIVALEVAEEPLGSA